MNITKLDYGQRVTFNRPRWCAICGTQRSTTRGVFDKHDKPNGKPCPNSGEKVNKAESVG